jgi:hypothetical protein
MNAQTTPSNGMHLGVPNREFYALYAQIISKLAYLAIEWIFVEKDKNCVKKISNLHFLEN